MTNWYVVESFSKPLEIDTTLSKKYVYIRKNINRIDVKDEVTNETITMYQYHEQKITHEQYKLYEIFNEMNTNSDTVVELQQTITDMDLRILELELELEAASS